ncbi:MAG TPA: hypothetical protein VEH31_02890, partial [Streptosporangiaceae bacterium]|nr:hypothetical protein [Streptosporangiaceae bacterium]
APGGRSCINHIPAQQRPLARSPITTPSRLVQLSQHASSQPHHPSLRLNSYAQAVKDLAYVKAVMAWHEPKNSKTGDGSICAHSSWLLFDGYALALLIHAGLGWCGAPDAEKCS